MKLVKFSSRMCAPCRALERPFAAFCKERGLEHEEVKIDTDEGWDLSEKLKVTSVPTIIVFEGKRRLARMTGLDDRPAKEQLEDLLARAYKKLAKLGVTVIACGPSGCQGVKAEKKLAAKAKTKRV